VGIGVNANAAWSYFAPTRVTAATRRYCSAPRCRRASKAASQARWLSKPENQGYFRDPWHVARVRAWRSRNPGYWRKPPGASTTLQDVSTAQATDPASKTGNLVRSPLQEVIAAQPAVLIGLIAHLVGTPLQEDIVRTADRLLRLGRDILALSQSPPA
jgi:hypothetical protein